MKFFRFIIFATILGWSPLVAQEKYGPLQPQGLTESLEIEFTEEEFGKWRRTIEICFEQTGDCITHFCPIDDDFENLSSCLVLQQKLPSSMVPDPSISMEEFLLLAKKEYSDGATFTWKILSQSENDAIVICERIKDVNKEKKAGDFVAMRFFKGDNGFSKIEYVESERLERYSIEKIQEILSRGRLVAPAQPEPINIHSGKEKNLIGTYFNLHNNKFFTLEFSDDKKWTHSPSLSSWNHSSVCYFPVVQGSGEEIPNRIKLGTQKLTDPEQFSIWIVPDYYRETYAKEADENEYSFSFRIISISKNEVLMSMCMKDERSQKEVFTSVVRAVLEGDLLHSIEIKDANPPKNFSKLPFWIELAKNAKISSKEDFGDELLLNRGIHTNPSL